MCKERAYRALTWEDITNGPATTPQQRQCPVHSSASQETLKVSRVVQPFHLFEKKALLPSQPAPSFHMYVDVSCVSQSGYMITR